MMHKNANPQTKLQFYILIISIFLFISFYAVIVLAPAIIWTSDSDWNGGTHGNTTPINGDLMLNNTIINSTQTIYSWFYNNRTYRKAILINGSTSLLNDYQIMINLSNQSASTDNFDFSKANSQGNDTRFTWLNASSGLEQNISFWIENWTSTSALIWVKVPNVTASSVANTTIYMYYGNPSSSSASNGEATFEFFDDFDRADSTDMGSKWSEYGDGNWQISSNRAYRPDVTTGRNDFAFARVSGSLLSVTDTIVESKINITAMSGDNSLLGIKARANTETSFGHRSYDFVRARGTQLLLVNPEVAVIEWITTTEPPINEWWNWKLQVNGNTMRGKVWKVGEYEPSSWVLEGTATTQASGYVGMGTREAHTAEAYYDDFRVRKYGLPEPNVLSVGAEQAAVSRGTYLSNTITVSRTITSITPTWNSSQPNPNSNFTVDVSADGGSSWCSNVINNTQYNSSNSCGGIGSGTQLQYRVNFSTNDTTKTASLSDLRINYIFNTTTITSNLALHLGPSFSDDSIQTTGKDICISDPSGWFGLTAENPIEVQSGNLTGDYNINASFASNDKAFLIASRDNCNSLRRYANDVQMKRFLSPLVSFSYPKTNIIQLILQFDRTDITTDAHWGRGIYTLSIANERYNFTTSKRMLSVNILKSFS